MSHQSLQSFDMQEKLRDLRTNNDPFWTELSSADARHRHPVTAAVVAEDIMANPEDANELDDSAVSLKNVIAATHHKNHQEKRGLRVKAHNNGGLMMAMDADDVAETREAMMAFEGEEAEDQGRGKRKRKRAASKKYSLADFARHWDGNGSDME